MSPVATIFSEFASNLRTRRVRHAFLRGHQHFPEVRGASDVDVLIRREDRNAALAAFVDAARAAGFTVWQVLRIGFLTQLYAYRSACSGEHHFFDVDLHESECSFGVPFLTAASLLERTARGPGLPTLRPAPAAVVNALGHYFSGGPIPERHLDALREVLPEPETGQLLNAVLGKSLASALMERVRAGDPGWSARGGRAAGRAARRRALLQRPVASVTGWLGFLWGVRVRPILQPRGLFVAFLGPDGSGKSSLIDAVLERLRPRLRGHPVEVFHQRPKLLPPISALLSLGRKGPTAADSAEPHRAPPSGQLGSAMRATYYWLDYVLGYPLRVLPLRRRNSLIVFDRWFTDYLIDPRRTCISPRSPLPRLLKPFVPSPDRVVLCTAPVGVIAARKAELPPAEIARQLDLLRSLAATEEGAIACDTSRPLDECVDDVVRQLLSTPRRLEG